MFARIMMGLAEQAPDNTTISIDATYLKAHRTLHGPSLGLKKGACTSDRTDQRWDEYKTPRSYRRQRSSCPLLHHSGSRQRLYRCSCIDECPIRGGLVTCRQWIDADSFREGLIDRGARPCIAGRKSRKTTIKYDKRRYKRRNRIERMFGRIKDWRHVVTRYDRRPTVFLSAILLAATVIFWL